VMRECKKSGPAVFAQCAHAVGHGFLAESGYAEVTDALKLCDKASEAISEFPVFNCYDGVFMENVWGIHDGKPSPDRWVKNNDPVYPCNDKRIAEKYIRACWSNQPALMYQFFKGDIVEVGKECEKVSNEEYQQTCFNGLARQIHPIANGEHAEAFRLCGLLAPHRQSYCIGVIAGAAFGVGDRKMPFVLCAQTKIENKGECYRELFSSIAGYAKTATEKKDFCSSVSEAIWQSRCSN